MGYVTERLPGNGVESDFARRQRIQKLFR